MKLARRVSMALVLVLAAVLGVSAFLDIARERTLLRSDMEGDHVIAGELVATAFEQELDTDGVGEATDLLQAASRHQQSLRFRVVSVGGGAGGATSPDSAPLDAAGIARLSRGEPVFVRVEAPAPGRALSYLPLKRRAGAATALEISESLGAEQRHVHAILVHAVVSTLVLAALCVTLTMGVGAVVVGRPIRALTRRARSIGAGDFSSKLGLAQDDEIGELGAEVDAMSAQLETFRSRLVEETDQRIKTLEQLRHVERLTTVGKLASGLAHELGSPLTVIQGHAELLEAAGGESHDVPRAARIIAQQADRMTHLISQLLDFARRQHPRADPCELSKLARDTASLLAPMAAKRGVELAITATPGLPDASGDAVQLQQVMTNLLLNALHATPAGGSIELAVGRTMANPPADHGGSAGEYLVVSVCDAGHGISPGDIGRIFEPFFTTKEVGEGTGLGLSVSYGIIRDHGGWIAVDSDLRTGSRFRFYLPSSFPEGESPRAP